MNIKKISDFKGGWFIGAFEPTLYNTSYFEVAVKDYKAGDEEPNHYHKLADEYTIVAVGEVEMNGETYKEGDIIHVNINECVKFKAITDAKTLVIKLPSIKNDKYIVE